MAPAGSRLICILRKRYRCMKSSILAPVLLFVAGLCAAYGQALAPEKPPADLKPVKVSEEEFKLGSLSFNPKTREIWFPCRVNQDEVVLEFAISEEKRGKLHEALLSTKTTPFEVQVAMKLLRWEPSKRDIFREYDEEGQPIGELKDDGKGRMEILIRHTPKGGEEVTEPLGNWVHNAQTKEPVGKGVWTYTGSKVIDGYFLAAEDGAIAAIYRYDGALCNAFNSGSDDDELWFPISDKVPPLDTPVVAVLRRLPDAEVPAERRINPEIDSKKRLEDKPEGNPKP